MSSPRPRKFDLTFLCESYEYEWDHPYGRTFTVSFKWVNEFRFRKQKDIMIYIENEALRYEDLNINEDSDNDDKDDNDDNDDEDLEMKNVTIVLARMSMSRDFCVCVLYDVVVGDDIYWDVCVNDRPTVIKTSDNGF
ncbi:hypothetical protein L1887_28623 [Cichorium endivia]|nr:hypothetical protein L1887_28623 [Cichorium endivia]